MKNVKLYEIYFNRIKNPALLDFIIYYLYKLNDLFLFKDKLYNVIYKLERKKFGSYPQDTKLIETFDCDFMAQTVDGYNICNKIHRTIPYEVYEIMIEDRSKLLCADTHMLFADICKGQQGWRYVNELKINDFLYTADGWQKIISIKKKNYKMFMCDISMK